MTISASPTFAFSGFHHINITIPVGGEERSRNFWGATLGMVEIEKPPLLAKRAGCWFRAGAVEIHLSVDINFAPEAKAHPGYSLKIFINLPNIWKAIRLHCGGMKNFPPFNVSMPLIPLGIGWSLCSQNKIKARQTPSGSTGP